MKTHPDQPSVEHQPSETAMATATLRALAACDEREEIRGQDDLAQIFLTPDLKRPLQDPAARAWVMKNKITPLAVDGILRFIQANSPPGSSVCFDYAALSRETLSEDGARKLREQLKSDHPGEPAKFGIREGELEAFLSARVYTVVEHLTSGELEGN